jgi:hypothetical protein
MTVCADCTAELDPVGADTFIDVGGDEPVYRCRPCWRSLNNPVYQRRTARARQRRIESALA